MPGKSFKILALDGGGIRGLITAMMLERLEAEVGKPLAEVFDLIAGTSTGSILACGLAIGRSPSELRQLYKERGREVFPRSRHTAQLRRPKYNGRGLDAVLQGELGKTKKFGSVAVDTLVVAYNTAERRAEVFKSWRETFAAIPMWKVCRASCSAPTYFPGIAIPIKGNKPFQSPLIDGGVVANNPSAAAIAEGLQIMRDRQAAGNSAAVVPLKKFVLASFGAGSNAPPYTLRDTERWGLVRGAGPILNILMDGSIEATDYIASRMLEEGNHFRFGLALDKSLAKLDNASPNNLKALEKKAKEFLASPESVQRIQALAAKL